MSNIFLQISAISVIVAVIAWFYSIFEHIMAARFAPFAFEKGIPFTKTTKAITLNQSRIPSDEKLETKTGWIKFIDNQTCYFRPKWERKWFTLRPKEWLNAEPLMSTPFPIRGKISWQDGEARIEQRLPIGTSIFFLCVLVGFTAGCINDWVNGSFGCGLSLLIGGWIFIGGMVLFSIGYEDERAEKIIGELREYYLQIKQDDKE
ncbi:hypothetical protein ACFLXQ_08285 [Chloroflexota bacterium]